jgi:hypothetical protein
MVRSLVHLFLNDKKMDTVNSQIPDGSPPQRFIDPPIFTISEEMIHPIPMYTLENMI